MPRNQITSLTWPVFISAGTYAMNFSTILINILNFSSILFPGKPYQAVAMGALISSGLLASAFSTLLFGMLADRHPRHVLFTIMMVGTGAGCIINAVVPTGQGMVTFYLFLACNILRGAFGGGLWPVVASFTNDALQKDERSKFFGPLNVVIQLFQVLGTISGAVFVEAGLWRPFYVILGASQLASAVFDGVFLTEPKRGVQQAELQAALGKTTYTFKLTWTTLRSTVASRTNFFAILEGVFTATMFGITNMIIVPFLQTPPHNISSIMTSIVLVVFGIPGAMIGAIGLMGVSDRYGKKHVKYRIYILIIAIVIMVLLVNIVLFMPLPALDISQGNDAGVLFSLPTTWVIGLVITGAWTMTGLYNSNQPVILQEMNLPESQGLISSINNFTASLGNGAGPMLAGLLMAAFNQGFQAVALACIPIGLAGAVFWLIATRRVDEDLSALSAILKERAFALGEPEENVDP
jgi:MFS family permease